VENEDDIKETRHVFSSLLHMIADFQSQAEYQRDVPIANVPAELICQWFDDHYHPEEEWFKESFSEEERELMADFNDYYNKRIDYLPKTNDVFELQKSIVWQEIAAKAKDVWGEIKW
jgi:hypothetical protein